VTLVVFAERPRRFGASAWVSIAGTSTADCAVAFFVSLFFFCVTGSSSGGASAARFPRVLREVVSGNLVADAAATLRPFGGMIDDQWARKSMNIELELIH
jgi:hypothetical protein